MEQRLLAVIALCVVGASARAAFSGGPPGELYAGLISRTLEVGDRSDSRISYHTVQLIAHHLSPNEPAGRRYFAPWQFSSRGPLSGLAAAPVVFVTGGRPPREMPDQPWRPFDAEGFSAYRIAMITLGSLSLIAVFGLLIQIADEARAWIGVIIVALTPFFWHELYFTWPKLLSAGCVLGAFASVVKQKPTLCALWLGGGYLCHPLALLSAPFIGLWILLRPGIRLGKRIRHGAIYGVTVLVIVVGWQIVAGAGGTQGGFLRYLRAADGAYDISLSAWLLSRWANFANTLIPFYVFFFHAGHPAFNALGSTSSPLVHFYLQYWTALPFAAGLVTSVLLIPAIATGIRRCPRTALLLLIGPAFLLLVYWGATITGLMREGGHVLFLSLWVFLAWAASDRIPTWFFGAPLICLRTLEIAAMALLPLLVNTSSGNAAFSDYISLTVFFASLGTVVYILHEGCRSLITLPQYRSPNEAVISSLNFRDEK